MIQQHDERKIFRRKSFIAYLSSDNSTPKSSNNTKTDSLKESKDTKDKETGFFKRLFKHEKDADEESNKGTGSR